MAQQDTPEDIAVKAAAKSDLRFIYEVLGLNESRPLAQHKPCIFCNSSDAMQAGFSRNGGTFYSCYSCGAGGDVLNALQVSRNMSFPEVMKELHRRYGQSTGSYSGARQLPSPQARAYSNGTTGHSLPPPIAPKQRLLPVPKQELVYLPPIVVQQQALAVRQSAPRYGENEFNLVRNPQVVNAPPKRTEPVIDVEETDAFVVKAHSYLMNDFKRIMGRYKRGITEAVAKKYRLGFLEHEPIKKTRPWHSRGMTIPSAWVLPITDQYETLKGVKIHCEEAPLRSDGSRMEKCLWMPFGTEPKYDKATDQHPVNSYYTMWPHPDTLTPVRANDFSSSTMWWIERINKECSQKMLEEWRSQVEYHKFNVAYELGKMTDQLDGPDIVVAMEKAWFDMREKIQRELCGSEDKELEEGFAKNNRFQRRSDEEDFYKYIFICPGELKALSAESAGLMATAPTGGESWTPGADWMNAFYGMHIWLAYDDDPPRRDLKTGKVYIPGVAWAAKFTDLMKRWNVSSVVASGLGRKLKAPEEIQRLEREFEEQQQKLKEQEESDDF